jgi:subtilisin-like proprotein convertase family protein
MLKINLKLGVIPDTEGCNQEQNLMSDSTKLQTAVIPSLAAQPGDIPNDTDFANGNQWYLTNASNQAINLNLTVIWDEYRGAGITIGVIDDGVEYTHADLVANSNPALGDNFVQADSGGLQDGRALTSGDYHGTLVAGVIAADDNGQNVVGVAPDATLAGLRIGFGVSGHTSQILEAFIAAKEFDIVNNSWGFGGYFYDNLNDTNSFGLSSINPFVAINDALITAVDEGRGDLGTIFTFAAGNSGQSGQEVNYHGLLSSPHTIAVGGFNQYGGDYGASTPGAAVLVSGPAQSVRTTDRMGSAGLGANDTISVNGTSLASPAVAGVVALMLEANPNLGYRDVQEILTLTAEWVDPSDGSWAFNGATNWNGGGQHISHKLGFGSVDGYNAVRLAETWDLQSTYGNLMSITVPGSVSSGTLVQNTVVEQITVGNLGIDLDYVVLNLDMSHSFIGDLVITLESPDGTVSTLMNRPGFGAGEQSTFIDEFELTSVQYWGEDVAGQWILTVQDAGGEGSGTISDWSLTFLGDQDTGNDVYVYTSEWATFGAEASRQLLVDDGGTDTLNLAAISTAVTLDLTSGVSNGLLGHNFSIAAGTVIENAVSGDGDDDLTGNAANNWLRGMRGNDYFAGGAGDDLVDGGAGDDTAGFTGVHTSYQITTDVAGDLVVTDNFGLDGTDTLIDHTTRLSFFQVSKRSRWQVRFRGCF